MVHAKSSDAVRSTGDTLGRSRRSPLTHDHPPGGRGIPVSDVVADITSRTERRLEHLVVSRHLRAPQYIAVAPPVAGTNSFLQSDAIVQISILRGDGAQDIDDSGVLGAGNMFGKLFL